MVSWAEYGKYASFWDLEAPHVDGDMTGFVCRKQVVLLLVDFAKRAFWRHPRDIQEASERHSIGIFSFIWRQKLRKRRVSWCFFTIKAFFVEWTKREGVFRTKEGSVFRFICQWDSYNLFALFFMTLPKKASNGTKSGSDGCFTALATAARHILACRWRQSTPQSYALTSDCLHSLLVFWVGTERGEGLTWFVNESEI